MFFSQVQNDFLQLMMNAHELADKTEAEDDNLGGMKFDEKTTKGYKGSHTENLMCKILFGLC